VGGLALLAGNLLLFVLRFLPPPNNYYWLAPPAILAAGLWLLTRGWGKWVPVGLWAITLVIAFGLNGLIWPAVPTTRPLLSGVPGQGTTDGESLAARPVPDGHKVALKVTERFRRGPFVEPRFLTVPRGFSVDLFAAGLDKPRFMTFDEHSTLYVSLPRSGKIMALPDRDRDGIADRVVTFAEGLDLPHGLAWDKGWLVVAETGRLLRLRDRDLDLSADESEVLTRDLPAGDGHWTRTVVVGRDGSYFVSAGSSCNVCLEKDSRRASITRFNPEGGEGTLFSRGLRNSVGLAVHPATGELWGSDNGRDLLGDELPPEEINLIVEGGDYGWPFCYGDGEPDPDFGSPQRCAGTLPPTVKMQAHSAPLGIAFGAGSNFPEPYRSMLFVAFHGSWNRTVPTGYKLVGIPFSDGRPVGPVTDFATGWLAGATAWGRPVAPIIGPDGALYLSDDRSGAVYRITYEGMESPR